MKQFLIAPDSFKGTMDAEEVCQILAESIQKHIPDASVRSVPMSDGGEGMVDAYLSLLDGQRVPVTVSGPFGAPVDCAYGLLPDGTAVMEMASCAGLPLVQGREDPLHASTYGVGEMLLHIRRGGTKNVLLGIGGSATNDCGVGMLAALGYRFLDGGGRSVAPYACNLDRIARVEPPELPLGLRIVAACDVTNPLCGSNGAAYTFGRQKGATEEQLPELDRLLGHMAAVMERDTGAAVRDLPGAGAAGGMGAALVAFLNAELKPGVELVLDAVGFDDLLKDADIVFTGEGRIDWQSAAGKVPAGVARRARAAGVPCVALCGSVGTDADALYSCGMTAIFSSVMDTGDFDRIKENCRENLRFLADSVLRLLAAEGPDALRRGAAARGRLPGIQV